MAPKMARALSVDPAARSSDWMAWAVEPDGGDVFKPSVVTSGMTDGGRAVRRLGVGRRPS